MLSKHFKIVALGAVLLHLADGLLASRSHSHGPHAEQHTCHQAAEPVEHHHHGHCAHHAHEGATEPEQHQPSLPAHNDSHHCAACRHLAQAAAHQFVLVELPTLENVSPLFRRLPSLDVEQQASVYHSRGPPTIAL